jgi:hypothetical protein
MTLNTPDDNVPIGTPIYDQTWAVEDPAPAYESTAHGYSADENDSSGKAEAAKEEAKNVASDAKDAGQRVVGTTKDEAAKVVGEAKNQVKDLYGQATSELKDQAASQQKRVASGLRSMGDELGSMAQNSEGNSVASQLVNNLSGRASSVAEWLDGRDPGSLLSEVRSYAARKPGTFIALAAGAGILAGRLTKSLATAAKDEAQTAHIPAPAPEVQL